MKEQIAKALRAVAGLEVRLDEPMCEHTTFGLGGPADIFVEVGTEAALVETLGIARQMQFEWFLMGDGANLLVSDRGIRGVVLHLSGEFADVRCEGLLLRAGSAARISAVAGTAAKNGLTGFEGIATVPGSVGGAIVMNAGTYRGYIADVFVELRAVDPGGKLVTLDKEQCGFSYRGSRFQTQSGFIITEVVLELQQGDAAEITDMIEGLRRRRRETQPQGMSAGCFFKNPEGLSAGKLIEAAGLKGTRIGGASVAEEHANFIINNGSATAAEVLQLAKYVKEQIKLENSVDLEFEVRVVGDW